VSAHRYSPEASKHSSILTASLLPSFPMLRALPGSEYYDGSATPISPQPATDLPATVQDGQQ